MLGQYNCRSRNSKLKKAESLLNIIIKPVEVMSEKGEEVVCK